MRLERCDIMKIDYRHGAPFFESPGSFNELKMNARERGNWFAFKEDVDLNATEPEQLLKNKKVEKIKKVIKIVLAVIGFAIVVYFGYLFFREWYR